MDMPFGNDVPYYVYNFNSCCSSYVVDLTLIEEQFMGQIQTIVLNIWEYYNGLTIIWDSVFWWWQLGLRIFRWQRF